MSIKSWEILFPYMTAVRSFDPAGKTDPTLVRRGFAATMSGEPWLTGAVQRNFEALPRD